MSERIATDGGTILAMKPTRMDQSGANPEAGTVLFYYEDGVGFRYKLFGENAASLSSGVSPLTTKGDLWGYSTLDVRVPVGTDGQALFADSSNARGVAYAAITEGKLSLSNVTTGNVSITKHGFVPIAPNDATKYLDGTGAWSVPAGGGGGTDSLAFHKNGDSFGANVAVGTNDNFTLTLEANNIGYAKFAPCGGIDSRAAGSRGNILLGTMVPLAGATESGLQYRRDDTAATFLVICDQDGSQGQGYGESAVEVINNVGKSTIITAVGSAFAGTSFGYNTASQGRLRSSCDSFIFGTSSNADVAHISNNLVRMTLYKDGKLSYGGDLSVLTGANASFHGTTGFESLFAAFIGINVTSPTFALDVRYDVSGGNNALKLDNRHASGNPGLLIGNDPSGTSKRWYCYYQNSDNSFTMNHDGNSSGAWNNVTATSWNVAYTSTKRIEINSTGIGFFTATPVGQGAAVADASGGAVQDVEARAALNSFLARIRATGLIAT